MTEAYSFGRFKIDSADWQLYADGKAVPLGVPARKLLAMLIERAGTIVPKTELINQVWGTAAIGDNILHVHMTLLRRVIGEECIATKQGLGYRFIAPLRRSKRRPPTPVQINSGAMPPPHGSSAIRSYRSRPRRAKLIGRAQDLRDITRLVGHERLVTLTGPGGVGKTWLMLAAGESLRPRFPDGVWLVELASLHDPALVPSAIGTVLGVALDGAQSPTDTLARSLSAKNALILMDNCEHVIDAAVRVSDAIIAAARTVSIIATSRTALCSQAEQVFLVSPLGLPADDAAPAGALRKAAAIQLFAECAGMSDPDFLLDDDQLRLAARICRQVDGLPLAIQMVASWAATLGMEALAAKLGQSITAAISSRSSAPERHGTLRATFDWSYALLPARDQIVLRRLSAFADHFGLDAAERVVADDLVASEEVWGILCQLVRQSLIVVVNSGRIPKYRLLETTRAFSREKLTASEERDIVFGRHACFVEEQLARADAEWETTSDAVWLERYSPLLPDLRGSLDWTIEQPRQAARSVSQAGMSWPLWRELSLRAEGLKRISAAMARLQPDVPAEVEVRLRLGLGEMLANTSEVTKSQVQFKRVVSLCRSADDQLGLGRGLVGLSHTQLLLSDIDAAEATVDEACVVLERGGWPRAMASACLILVRIHARRGRFAAAMTVGERARRLCDVAGADRSALFLMANLMEVALESGDPGEAIVLGLDLLAKLRLVSHGGLLGAVLGNLTAAYTAMGDLEESLIMAHRAVALLRDHDMLFWLLDHLALRTALAGRLQDAALLLGYTDVVYRTLHHPRQPNEAHARKRLQGLLSAALTPAELLEWSRLGAMASEDRAITLALAENGPSDRAPEKSLYEAHP